LQRKPQGGSWTTEAWLPADATSYSDTGLSSGHWCYRLNAWNTAESSSSYATSSPTCVSLGGGGGPTAPATPSNLAASAISASRIDLSWNDNSDNETSFRLQRKPQGGIWTTVAWLPADTTSYSNTGLVAGSWCYRINAWNTAAASSVDVTSTPTCVSVAGGSPTAPATPSNLTAGAISPTRIDLSWNDNSNNETSFRLQRKPQGGSWTTAAWLPKDTTSFSDTGLAAGSWCYRVNAWNTADASSSNVLSTPRCVSVGGN